MLAREGLDVSVGCWSVAGFAGDAATGGPVSEARLARVALVAVVPDLGAGAMLAVTVASEDESPAAVTRRSKVFIVVLERSVPAPGGGGGSFTLVDGPAMTIVRAFFGPAPLVLLLPFPVSFAANANPEELDPLVFAPVPDPVPDFDPALVETDDLDVAFEDCEDGRPVAVVVVVPVVVPVAVEVTLESAAMDDLARICLLAVEVVPVLLPMLLDTRCREDDTPAEVTGLETTDVRVSLPLVEVETDPEVAGLLELGVVAEKRIEGTRLRVVRVPAPVSTPDSARSFLVDVGLVEVVRPYTSDRGRSEGLLAAAAAETGVPVLAGAVVVVAVTVAARRSPTFGALEVIPCVVVAVVAVVAIDPDDNDETVVERSLLPLTAGLPGEGDSPLPEESLLKLADEGLRSDRARARVALMLLDDISACFFVSQLRSRDDIDAIFGYVERCRVCCEDVGREVKLRRGEVRLGRCGGKRS